MSSKGSQSHGIEFCLNFILGGISGGVGKTLTAPLERIKIVLQTQDANDQVRKGEVRKFRGMFGGIKQIYQQQGFLALWRGNLLNVLRYVPTQAFNLAFVGLNKRLIPKVDPNAEKFKYVMWQIFAGGLAGAQSLIVVYPFDFARTRFSADLGTTKREFSSMRDFVSKIYKAEGIPGFYRGFTISLSFSFLYRGAYFGLYDAAKKLVFQKANLFEKFLAAQTVTVLAGTFVYPIDTIRRRLMMQSGKQAHQYTSSYQCARTILNEEGVKGFFKGGMSNIFRSLGGAFVLVIYDLFSNAISYH